MSLAELRACCGKKHGNTISTTKKQLIGQLKFKNDTMLKDSNPIARRSQHGKAHANVKTTVKGV